MQNIFLLKNSINYYKNNKSGLKFGLKSQGRFDFVSRALEDGAGWNDIALRIGWIGFAVFHNYYSSLYNGFLKNNDLILIEPHYLKSKGFIHYDNINNVWSVITSADHELTPDNFLNRYKIKNILFISNNKNLDTFIPQLNNDENAKLNFHMVENKPFSEMVYHANIVNNNDKLFVSHSDIFLLINDIIYYQDRGYKLSTDVFFDFITIDDNEKMRVDKKILNEKFNINIDNLI